MGRPPAGNLESNDRRGRRVRRAGAQRVTDETRPARDSVRLERTITAPRETVFDAWLTAEALKRWWPAGSDWETPVAEVDPRVGGTLRLVMRAPLARSSGAPASTSRSGGPSVSC